MPPPGSSAVLRSSVRIPASPKVGVERARGVEPEHDDVAIERVDRVGDGRRHDDLAAGLDRDIDLVVAAAEVERW